MSKTAKLLEDLNNLHKMKLSPNAIKIFRHARHKSNVSIDFIKSNVADIRQFVINAMRPHLVIKIKAMRKFVNNNSHGEQKVILNYSYPRRFPLNPTLRRRAINRHKRFMQYWSKRMVLYLKNINITCNYIDNSDEEDHIEDKSMVNMPPEEVSKQLKEQLELLRLGKRTVTLIEGGCSTNQTVIDSNNIEAEKVVTSNSSKCENDIEPSQDSQEGNIAETTKIIHNDTDNCTIDFFEISKMAQENAEKTPEKQIVAELRNDIQDNFEQKSVYNIEDEKTEEEEDQGNTVDQRNGACRGNGAVQANVLDRGNSAVVAGDVDGEEGGDGGDGNKETPLKTNKPSGNFLDMLMSKVRKLPIEDNKSLDTSDITPTKESYRSSLQNDTADLTDSSEDFLGFEESEPNVPGMLSTPIVPYSKRNSNSSAFVSESLNEYMRENLLGTSVNNRDTRSDVIRRVHRQANLDGLVTPTATPPAMSMPAVPDSLLRLRTVAERRHFLQKFSKNHKLAIINNEATIYRELQRKVRQQKVKSATLQMLQTPGTQMPFTRQGWQAASFVVTDYNKYYYQVLQIDGSDECIKLPGVCGNNENKLKKTYLSKIPKSLRKNCCSEDCYDQLVWRDFKPIKTVTNKALLHKNPFRPVLPPCPLSHKPFQKPLDEETAALLLAGGSMAVVKMPTVELEVFPEISKPLHEIAKRYLEYILPHQEISREWAEFSVSTLQQHRTDEKLNVVASTDPATADPIAKSFTFPIPYLNDRNHILVRRVVDRSEQLDCSFDESHESSILSFRAGIDPEDKLLNECADVVNDMINSVAISCSENSFIKNDPHGISDKLTTQAEKTDDNVKSQKLKECAEDTFKSEGKLVVTSQLQSSKKQKSLLLELRRLNATIIDAGTKPEKASKPCYKDHCLLGCICSSLTDEYPLRQHCGKSKCVIECHCRMLNNSRIMRLETDGRSITTEDAFLLRRQATARLARMEKEFTSTIVLTGNETLLINDSQYDKKRRCTKAPKRYDDFTDADDDCQGATNAPTPRKSGALISIETSISPGSDDHNSMHSNGGTHLDLNTEIREPIYIKDTIINDLKHCTVTLVPLEDTKNMAVWCMVHELYKCFCGGRAVEGKAVTIEKEEDNAMTSNVNTELVNVVQTSKARYSFEKTEIIEPTIGSTGPKEVHIEESISSKVSQKAHDSDSDVKEVISSDNDEHFVVDIQNSINGIKCHLKRGRPLKIERRGRPMEGTIIRDYLNAKINWCRRAVPIPMKTYTRRNRKRVLEVQEFIKKHENEKTQLILNEHILRSVYYHKNEFEKLLKANREREQKKKMGILLPLRNAAQHKKTKKPHDVLSQQENLTNEDADDDDDDVQFVEESTQPLQLSQTSTKSSSQQEPRKRQITESLDSSQSNENSQSYEPIIKKLKIPCEINNSENDPSEIISLEVNDREQQQQETQPNQKNDVVIKKTSPPTEPEQPNHEKRDEKVLEKIADTVSTSNEVISNGDTGERLTCSSTLTASERQSTEDLGIIEGTVNSENFKEFYNVVIKNMNNLVSKKMQDIDMALKRESKVIPPPNEEILCIIKWSNFLDAFVEGFVFIWQVQLEKQQRPFFAATITNLMPMILGAVAVVNIAAMKSDQLPLIGRMLVEQCRSEQTHNLAIVMQGRSKYWLVKGFLHPDSSKACAKPTPQTHPALTRKINLLCSLLVKQRVKEHQRKLELQQMQKETTMQEQTETENEHLAKRLCKVDNSNILPGLTPFLPTTPTNLEESSKRTENASTESVLEHVKQQNQTSINPGNKSEESKRQPSQSNTSLLRNLSTQPELINMKTNIEFRKVTQDDIVDIQQPEMLQEDHRWLVLDLHNDFSHIFVPDFSDLVSLDRIQKVMAFSRQKQKIVKLQFFQDAPFDAFVTPVSKRKIYFGPLKFNMRPPLLILLQSVDGHMMMREVFQKEHQIQTNGKQRTTAFWILQVNQQIKFEFETDVTNDNELTQKTRKVDEPPEPENSDEEDCIIIENEPQTQMQVIDNLESKHKITETNAIISDNLNNFPENHGLKNLSAQPNKPLDTQSNITHSSTPVRMNFTIQTMDDNNQLQIIQNSNNPSSVTQLQSPLSLVPLSVPLVPTNTQIPGFLPLSVVITNAATAPQESPYSSTIFVRNVQEAQLFSNDSVLNKADQITEIDNTAPLTSVSNIDSTARSSSWPMMLQSTPAETTANQSLIVKRSGLAPIKRRRMSLRCPLATDMETRNIAIDAAIKLMPESENLPKDVCSDESENSNVAKRQKLMEFATYTKGVEVRTGNTVTSQTTATTTTTMLRPTTTITKIKDATIDDSATKLTGNDMELSPKLKYLLPKSTIDLPQKCMPPQSTASATSSTATATPIVFDVNFRDSSEEPSASIVIKPTPSSTSPANTIITNSNQLMVAPLSTSTTSNAMKCVNDINNLPMVSKTTLVNNSTIVTTAPALRYSSSLTTASCLTTSATSLSTPFASIPPTVGNANKKSTLPTKLRLVKQTASTTLGTLKTNATPPSNVSHPQKLVASLSNTSNGYTSTATGVKTFYKELSDIHTTKCNIIRLPKPSAILHKAKTCNQVNPLETTTTSKNTSLFNACKSLTPPISSPSKKIAALTASVAPQRRSSSKSGQTKISSTITKPIATSSSSIPVLNMFKTKISSLPSDSSTLTNVQNPNSNNDVQYGYIATNIAGVNKFVVKRIGNDYLIKIPSLQGILKLTGLANVSAYLNKYIAKTMRSDQILKKLPASWAFFPQDRMNTTNRQKHSAPNQCNSKLNVGTYGLVGNTRTVNVTSANNARSGQLASTATIRKPAARVAPNLTAAYAPPPFLLPPPAPSMPSTTLTPQDQCDTILIED